MIFADNLNLTDPTINLALEEYLLRHVRHEQPILLFYVNEPAVIIGRNQNTLEEIDPDYVKAKGIHVVRRLSGGGAVYHDRGNLNFSFITTDNKDIHNFAKFTEPVTRVLNQLGVPAVLHGKSDIFVDKKKISGNAQFAGSGRMFSHGTILFDTSIEEMLKALNPRQIEIESNAVQSVRSFVTNIRDYLPVEMSIEALKEALLQGIFGAGKIETIDLSEADWERVHELSAERYRTWEWNVGRSPRYNMRKTETFPVGKFDARLEVERGLIQNLVIYGNFPSRRDPGKLIERIIGQRHDPDALRAALQDFDLTPFVGMISLDQFINLLY